MRAQGRSTCGHLLPTPERLRDLVERRFGRLSVVGYTGAKTKHDQKKITCRCDCGTYVDVMPANLRAGATTSCGCLHTETVKAQAGVPQKHGHATGGAITTEYRAYHSMISRCENPNDSRFKWYGARNIKVCKRWRDSFEHFLVDVGKRPTRNHSLDRIDNDGNYEPGNVRWATSKQQGRNKRTTKYYELDGTKRTLGEWCEFYDVDHARVQQRISKFGWALREALERPPVGAGRNRDRQTETKPRKKMYHVWYMIIDRCTNPGNPSYPRYGGRGITICDAWRNSFEVFLHDVGYPPTPQHTIDRDNNDRGYQPGNVRWATATQQNRNRRNTRRYTLNGVRKTLAEWAELADLPYQRVRQRVLTFKWPLDEALGTPIGMGRCPRNARRRWTGTNGASSAE